MHVHIDKARKDGKPFKVDRVFPRDAGRDLGDDAALRADVRLADPVGKDDGCVFEYHIRVPPW